MPDLLYEREMALDEGPRLLELRLRVEELSAYEVILAQAVRTTRAKLSLPDAFAFALAQSRGHVLLTGDGESRAFAQESELPVHCTLWMCDRIFEQGCIAPAALVEALERIAGHARCRLPYNAVRTSLERYHEAGAEPTTPFRI